MDKVRAKKHLGQHFLTDQRAAEKIVDLHLAVNHDLPVLEIGPGMGVLTKYLMEKQPGLIHVAEIDRESVAYLKQHYPELTPQIHEGDFLRMDLSSVMHGDFTVVGNFPYNISSQILFKVIENKTLIPAVSGMFQKEMAQRVAAGPGTKVYGILSVLMQAYYTIEYCFTVNEGAFNPPPKVKSGVIRCVRKPEEQWPKCAEKSLFIVVKTAFNQRRKMLSNTLKGLQFSEPIPEAWQTMRPEQLTLDQFATIASLLV
jgi:16S rRNA (adenine1518-N6/adenine1519-N6)-dimethyltransferase